MMKAVLKTLAISFGGGLALGAGIRLTQGPAKSRREPGIDLDPVLARLKSVEGRIVQMEATRPVNSSAAPAPSPVVEKTLAAFESRLAAQFTDVQQLRSEIRHVDQRLVELDAQLPVIIHSTVDVRFQEAERKLQQDFEEAQSRTMAAFVETLQSKVVERISTLESNLAEQSNAIGKLRDTSLRTDENLQKMVAGIEQLVEHSRTPQPPPSPANASPAAPALPHEPATAAHRAEPAIAHSEVSLSREPAPAHAAGLEQPVARYSEPPAEALLFSEASMGVEVPEDIPVLAQVPEIDHARVMETVHANGAVSEPPLAESRARETLLQSEPAPDAQQHQSEESYEWVNRIGLELLAPRPKPRMGWRIPVLVGLVAGLILIAGLLYSGVLQRFFNGHSTTSASTLASSAPAAETASSPPIASDLPSLEQRAASQPNDATAAVELGRAYQRRKDWTKAEAAFRSALEASPANRDAALGLSDVLYQEQKYEESAAVLNKLSSSKSQ